MLACCLRLVHSYTPHFIGFLAPEEAKFEEESEAVIICPVFTVPGSTVSWSKRDGGLPEESVQSGNKLT